MSKRINMNEEQYDKFLKQFEVQRNKGSKDDEVPKEGTVQAISNMRHQQAEINHSILRITAHECIEKAFKLGTKWTKTHDQEEQVLILKKLERLNKKIDTAV